MQFEGVQYTTPADELMQKEEATEQGETIDFSEIQAIPADALPILLRLILPSTNPLLPQFWRTASVRLCTTAAALNVHPVGGHPLSDLARAIGCSRAALSFAAVNLRDFANLGHRGGRCDAARAAYSEATKAAWTRRKQKSEG